MEILDKVREAGVIGAGGAGFPTHVKLKAEADFVLLNGAECEPLLRVDQQIMARHPREIIGGLLLAKEQVGAKKAIIGIKKKHPKVIKILEDAIEEMGLSNEISVGQLPDIYPAGDEQVLVYELTGRVVPEMGIPLEVGCVVVNSETALNIWESSKGIPVVDKYVTIAGDVPNPITVKVPVGTPLDELYKMAGITDIDQVAVIDGGPMMGPLIGNVHGYVTKKTKGLVILPKDHSLIGFKKREMRSAISLNKTACEGCSLCTDLCPRYLLGHSTSPHKMVRAMGYDVEMNEQLTVSQTCCQCNLCEYFSCPAGINPKMANVYFMNKLRQEGVRHQRKKDVFVARENRDYRLIPSKRLIARLNIDQFDKKAPLTEDVFKPEMVGISLKSHVGAAAKPIVEIGAALKRGELIALIPEGSLGANVHASIDGVVTEVGDDLIKIERQSV